MRRPRGREIAQPGTPIRPSPSRSSCGARVGLLDIDVYGPSVPLLLGVKDARPGVDAEKERFVPVKAHGLDVMSLGFLIDDDQPAIWRGPIVGRVVTQLLKDVEWGDLDFMVIDLPPGTGDAQLTLSQEVPLSGVIIVTTPSELALVDSVKGLQMFRTVNAPVVGLVENMSHYVCPSCGHESHPFNSGGTARISKDLDVALLGQIPIDTEIQRGGDEGKPVVAIQPDSPHAKAFLELAAKIGAAFPIEPTPDEGSERRGLVASIFKR